MNDVSDRLRRVREHLGLSQKSISARFGLGENTWQRLEHEGRLPRDEALQMLAEGGFSMDWLIAGRGEMLLNDAKNEEKMPSDGISREIVYNVAYHIAKKNRVGAKPDAFADLVIELCDFLTDAVRKGKSVDANVTENVFDFATRRMSRGGGS